jgi:hypothetical protein
MKLQILALFRGVLPAATVVVASLLSSCASNPVEPSRSESAAYESAAKRVAGMPAASMGTKWGEARDSHVKETMFERAGVTPDGVGDLRYYDDTVVDRIGGTEFRGPRVLAGGKVSVGLKDTRGRWLGGVDYDGRVSIMGSLGERYEIVVRNLTSHRIEVVVSVDGLDVLDGRSASYSKRGYLIESRGSVTISGWRTSSSSVAAFRFSNAGDSYSSRKYGSTRNLGVIGVAVFTEKLPPMRVFAEPPSDTREPNPFPGERWARPPQG